MHHMIAAKDRAHLCRGQDRDEWQVASEGPHFAAPAFGCVHGGQQQRGPSGAYRLAHFFEAGHRDAGSARQPDRLAATLCQQRLDAIRKIPGQCQRPARSAREQSFRNREPDYIAARS